MVKNLFLVRHAEATKPVKGQPDQERPLTQNGYRNVMLMGKFLYDRHIRPDLIMSSTAQRAETTAKLMAEQLQMEQRRIRMEEELYESSARIMLRQVQQLNNQLQQVLMVGHNPSITYLSEYLTGEEIGDIQPCGIVKLDLDVETWGDANPGNTWLAYYEFPESVKAKSR